MKNITNDERFDEIESICALLNIKECDLYLRKIPLEREDSTGEKFGRLSILIQAIAMWPTTIGQEKCSVARVVLDHNEEFNIPIANIAGYYTDTCQQ